VSARGAVGGARGLEEDVAVRKQEMARRQRTWRHGRWRCNVGETGAGQRGVGKAVGERGRTRGSTGSRR
jgi:hypothetical protein